MSCLDDSRDALIARDLANDITSITCSGCGRIDTIRKRMTADFFHAHFVRSTDDEVEFHYICNPCQTTTCVGCGDTVTVHTEKFGATAAHGKHITWHCDRGRLALIWMVLCGYDYNVKYNNAVTAPKPIPEPKRKPKDRRYFNDNTIAGVGYSMDYVDDEEVIYSNEDFTDFDFDTSTISQNLSNMPESFPTQPTDVAQLPPIQPTDVVQSLFTQPPDGNPLLFAQPTDVAQPLPAQPTDVAQSLSTQPPDTTQSLYIHPSEAPVVPLPPRKIRKERSPSPLRIDPEDGLTTITLSALCVLLPNKSSLIPTAFDGAPPPILTSIFLRSSILDKVAALLRNNSLEDATQRYELYASLFSFIRTIAAHDSPVMTALLHGERATNKLGHNLMYVSYGLPTLQHNEAQDTSTSLASSIEGLAKQCIIYLKGAAVNQADFQTEESLRTVTLCTSISDCAKLVRTSIKAYRHTCGRPRPALAGEHGWQSALAVLPVDDHVLLASHHYAKEAQKLASAPTGRMRKLVSEIATLTTSLPPGIFVRYGESRLDVMKVLIVGPKDTPYENGLFEFDLFCPSEYPNAPPKMSFKTTGGGTARFNPNLYPNGKVCLSLINTWHGEKWRPNKSTLLQVLVSIQAMVFCAEPWCNEPGEERHRGTEVSKSYDRRVRQETIRHAMLGWIDGHQTPTYAATSIPSSIPDGLFVPETSPASDQPSAPQATAAFATASWGKATWTPRATPSKVSSSNDDQLWGDVVKQHFDQKKLGILGTVGEWVKDKPTSPQRPKRKFSTPALALEWAENAVDEPIATEAPLRDHLKRVVEKLGGNAHSGLSHM